MNARLAVRDHAGHEQVLYEPFPHEHCAICDAAEAAGTYDPAKATQRAYHASEVPNLLALGTRGTGKSLQLRMDFLLRCLMIPRFPALLVRRTMPELRRSHLVFIDWEMEVLGGVFLHTTNVAKFANGSTLTLAHCETEADVMNFLSAQYGAIGFDELSTFTLAQFLQISSAARAPVDAHYRAVVRASSNTLGIGSGWMKEWFVDKTVNIEDYPDYHPDDFAVLFSTLKENPHLDREQYAARLKNLPEHVRRSWLLGEFITEGQYFSDFHPTKEIELGEAA
jgi:phage terminase large subunit